MTAIDCACTVTGKGPPLFMVHGIGARRATWDRITERLQDRFTCIRYDLRGHGDSPMPPLPFGLDDLVADLEALRKKLGYEKTHVIGHSLGGMIGPRYAYLHPDRVASLGILSTAAFRTEDDAAKVQGVVAAMREKGIEPVLNALIDRWFTDDFVKARPDAIERRLRQVMETPKDVWFQVFDIYATTEMAPWLDAVTAPSLVLTGELDGGCNPRLNRLIDAALPHSELVILDGLKHAIMIEASDRVADHLVPFLEKWR